MRHTHIALAIVVTPKTEGLKNMEFQLLASKSKYTLFKIEEKARIKILIIKMH